MGTKLAANLRIGDRIAQGSTVVRIKGPREAGDASILVLRDEDGEWRTTIRPADHIAMWEA